MDSCVSFIPAPPPVWTQTAADRPPHGRSWSAGSWRWRSVCGAVSRLLRLLGRELPETPCGSAVNSDDAEGMIWTEAPGASLKTVRLETDRKKKCIFVVNFPLHKVMGRA